MDSNFINESASMNHPERKQKVKIIKRYGNRKLYDTEHSSYVVLKDIAKMICNEENVRVIDNETKSDITSATLTQIIFGAEKQSSYSTPLDILKSIIKKGDGSFSNFLAEMGLFKSEFSEEKTIYETKNNNHYSTPSSPKAGRNNYQHKTLQERVVNAALSPEINESDNPILPSSSNESSYPFEEQK